MRPDCLPPPLRAVRRLALLASIALSACAQAQQFTLGDVSNAGMIATANQDTSAASCWQALQGALMPSPNPSSDGLAVLIQRDRLLSGTAAGPCASVILPVIMQLGSFGLRIAVPGL